MENTTRLKYVSKHITEKIEEAFRISRETLFQLQEEKVLNCF